MVQAHRSPMFASLTTIPSRIGQIKPMIESLLQGEILPTKIFVNIPEFSKLEGTHYRIPDFLSRDFPKDIVIVNTIPEDFGPGTKILGPLDLIPSRGSIILVDDDVVYHKSFLAGFATVQAADPNSAFSFYVYREKGLTIGQGCDGFSLPCQALGGLSDFFRAHVEGTTLVYHDDLWISYFLACKGIRIRQIAQPSGSRLIYEQVLPNTVLSALDGDRKRETITTTHLKRLRAEFPLPVFMQLRAWLMLVYDEAKRLFDGVRRRTFTVRAS